MTRRKGNKSLAIDKMALTRSLIDWCARHIHAHLSCLKRDKERGLLCDSLSRRGLTGSTQPFTGLRKTLSEREFAAPEPVLASLCFAANTMRCRASVTRRGHTIIATSALGATLGLAAIRTGCAATLAPVGERGGGEKVAAKSCWRA